MNARNYKAMYSQDYVQKILKMPTQKQKERLENAKHNVDYLRNGIHKGYFGEEIEVLALARMLRENNLLRAIKKNIKGI